jgi:xylulokinase
MTAQIPVTVGLDIGTSGSKAVAVAPDGTVVALRTRPHHVANPRAGWFEQDAEAAWWAGPAELLRDLMSDPAVNRAGVQAVAVSGMGPCAVLADGAGHPLGPAILYGIDTRATAEVDELSAVLGEDQILTRTGSTLTSQAVGPKLLWLRRHEPGAWANARMWLGPAALLVHRLTGRYVTDHHTASQCQPLYDLAAADWADDWVDLVCADLPMPDLAWADDVVGTVTASAAAATGLLAGTPVLAGTIDAWAEAHSVGVRAPSDLMLMYGSTMFLIGVTDAEVGHPGLWRTAGLSRGSRTVAAGMATSGLLTSWISDLSGQRVSDLSDQAAGIAPGADGLLLLPYFAGERSPLFDPGARGVLLGLQLRHGPAHLMRAAYEAIAMGVRHNLEAFDAVASAVPDPAPWRAVAVGGGASAGVWPQIVSDVTGLDQHVPAVTTGAAYGDALLAAAAAKVVAPQTDWTRESAIVRARPELKDFYDRRYDVYREAYAATRPLLDRLSG